jgi:integrase/recombinase XerC
VRAWLAQLSQEQLSSRSINRKLSSLKSYFKYLLRKQFISTDPTEAIQLAKVQRKLPAFVPQQEILSYFAQVATNLSFNELRDCLLMELLYLTGMRVSELCNLHDNDLDPYRKTIRVTGKRNKLRYIPLPVEMLRNIAAFQTNRNEEFELNEPEYLFLSKTGKRITRQEVYTIVKNVLTKITTISKKSPHVLRHSFATHMLNNGADLNVIKEILGHSNLSATEVYTHNTFEKLKQIYQNAHPRV